MCSSEKGLHTYVVCPKCYTLYKLEECIIRQRNGTDESAKCSFVQYPNHPHVSRRERCNAILNKRTEHGSDYRLIPCKVYIHNNLKASLTKLFESQDFLTNVNCGRTGSNHWEYTLICDGLVWAVSQWNPFSTSSK